MILDNWEDFCSKYKVIYASGGLVYNNDSLLMIFRNGKWDLPKGKKDLNESDESCAIREVQEECGVDDITIIRFLQNSYHTYSINSKQILKITSWFLMNSNYQQKLIPQISEGISKASWVKKNEISDKLKNSYNNIADLLSEI